MNDTSQNAILSGEEVDRRIRQAVRNAVLEHKRLGNPIAIWRDGQVVIIPPEEIVVPNEEATNG